MLSRYVIVSCPSPFKKRFWAREVGRVLVGQVFPMRLARARRTLWRKSRDCRQPLLLVPFLRLSRVPFVGVFERVAVKLDPRRDVGFVTNRHKCPAFWTANLDCVGRLDFPLAVATCANQKSHDMVTDMVSGNSDESPNK
jgi:hypothetical protein